MPDILIYVGDVTEDDNRVIRLAAELVEYVTAEGDALGGPIGRVALVVPVEESLDVALPMLGRAQARTVESGERRRSGVTVFPWLAAPNRRDETDSPTWQEARAGLGALVGLGAVEAAVDAAGQPAIGAPADMLQQAWGEGEWEVLVTFGGRGDVHGLLSSFAEQSDVRLVDASVISEVGDPGVIFNERSDGDFEDRWREARFDGRREALQFEELLIQLNLVARQRPRR